MILYHGSSRVFEAFQISEALVQHNKDHLAEGIGIYLTEDRAFAASYGAVVYEVEVPDDNISDFTNKESILLLLETMSKAINLPLLDWLNVDFFVQSVLNGNLSVTKLYREIALILDNNATFYEAFEADFSEQIEEAFYKETKDVLKYYDPSFERAIYICIEHPEKLIIKNR